MRATLERLDLRGLVLDTGGEAAAPIRVVAADEVTGSVEVASGRTHVSNLRAASIGLDALALAFGALSLEAPGGLSMATLSGACELGGGPLALELSAMATAAPSFTISVGTTRVSSEVAMDGVAVSLAKGAGRIEAGRVTLQRFSLSLGELVLDAATLAGSSVSLGWGDGGFWLRASELTSPRATLKVGGAHVTASALHVADLLFADGQLQIGNLTAEGADVVVELEAPPPGARAPEAEAGVADGARRRFDWTTLDRAKGEVNVDLTVDLTVPILGHRRATHEFRARIEGGALDFRELENDLETLENALLDFAVRDGGLVLERGIPLLPTRGRGKPIVRWELTPADLALAEQNRVRLSVLRGATLVKDPEAGERESSRPPAVSLRELGVGSLDLKLSIERAESDASAAQVHVRRLGGVNVTGNIVYEAEAEAPRPGTLVAELRELDAKLCALRLGGARVDLERLAIAAAPSLEVTFAGLRPKGVRAALSGLALTSLSV